MVAGAEKHGFWSHRPLGLSPPQFFPQLLSAPSGSQKLCFFLCWDRAPISASVPLSSITCGKVQLIMQDYPNSSQQLCLSLHLSPAPRLWPFSSLMTSGTALTAVLTSSTPFFMLELGAAQWTSRSPEPLSCCCLALSLQGRKSRTSVQQDVRSGPGGLAECL